MYIVEATKDTVHGWGARVESTKSSLSAAEAGAWEDRAWEHKNSSENIRIEAIFAGEWIRRVVLGTEEVRAEHPQDSQEEGAGAEDTPAHQGRRN